MLVWFASTPALAISVALGLYISKVTISTYGFSRYFKEADNSRGGFHILFNDCPVNVQALSNT